jgi:hypothetical protein
MDRDVDVVVLDLDGIDGYRSGGGRANGPAAG